MSAIVTISPTARLPVKPIFDLVASEFPKPSGLSGRQPVSVDPFVDSVTLHPEEIGDLVDREQTFRHWLYREVQLFRSRDWSFHVYGRL
jgi:hypothetical protein